jgi:hypothetical protein
MLHATVDFWGSLAVEIIGGLVIALTLGVGAAFFAAAQQVRSHDERVADLCEDNRRWFRDRDARLKAELSRLEWEHAARGLSNSSIAEGAKLASKHAALHEYRDELSAKRRRYRELRDAEGKAHQLIRRRRSKLLPRFELTDTERAVLASWRANLKPDGTPAQDDAIEDPTSDELEPGLRRFEREGDPPRG